MENWELFRFALGLYAGEGEKSGQRVAIANTDPHIHRVFIAFLDQICGVHKRQLKAWINIYDDRSVVEATKWWCEQVGLDPDQLYPPVVRASRGGIYANKSKYGTLTIMFLNTKLAAIVLGWCSEYYARFPVTK